MGDEHAAVEKLVQRAQEAGKARGLGEVVRGQAVGVGGAGVGAGVDHGVELFAHAPGGVERDRVDGEQTPCRRVNPRGLGKQRHVGVVVLSHRSNVAYGSATSYSG